MTFQHTPECIAETEKFGRLQSEFLAEHPNYCRSCRGAGMHSWTENGAPHGAGFWAMPMSEGCDDCVGQGKCPLCGEQVWDPDADVDHLVCPKCGYDDQATSKDIFPEIDYDLCDANRCYDFNDYQSDYFPRR